MISIVKYISQRISQGRRRLKAQVLGSSDVQEVYESMPFGEDSVAPDGFKALYAETQVRGKAVIIGYINTNQLDTILKGEKRIYSTNEAGDSIQAFINLRNDGQIELLGTGDFLVRFTPLESALTGLKDDIQAELTKIATGITGAGGSYTPGTLDIDISSSRIDEIETP